MHKYCHTIPKYRHTIPKYCHTIPKFLFRLCNLDEIFLQIVSLIDSEVLASVGETDLSKYNSIKGTKNEQLAADYFSFIEKEIRFIYIKFNLRLLLYRNGCLYKIKNGETTYVIFQINYIYKYKEC